MEKYTRTNATQRKLENIRQTRYLHVSVQVGRAKSATTGLIDFTRTPPGKGGTARRAAPKLKGKEARRARLEQRG